MSEKICRAACHSAETIAAVNAVNALGVAMSRSAGGAETMSDEWLVKHAGQAARLSTLHVTSQMGGAV
jgi:hypothetical protein